MLSKKSSDTPKQDGHSVPRNAVHTRDLKGRERERGEVCGSGSYTLWQCKKLVVTSASMEFPMSLYLLAFPPLG